MMPSVCRVQDGMPAAVLWDMDGTLVDSEPLWDRVMTSVAARHGLVLSEQLNAQMLGCSLEDSLARIHAAAGKSLTEMEVRRERRWACDRVRELFSTELSWQPGARAALEFVAHLHIPMALVTNTPRELADPVIAAIGSSWFTFTVCGDEVPHGKPAPDPYRAAAAALGVMTDYCLAVEDSPVGAASATAAGCATLVVDRAQCVPEAPRRTFRRTLSGLDLADLAL